MTDHSDKAEKELIDVSKSDSLKKDMEFVASNRHNPFLRNGAVDVDAYVEFVTEYNEFINHKPKPFVPMAGLVMKL
jgi:hypothetical protein